MVIGELALTLGSRRGRAVAPVQVPGRTRPAGQERPGQLLAIRATKPGKTLVCERRPAEAGIACAYYGDGVAESTGWPQSAGARHADSRKLAFSHSASGTNRLDGGSVEVRLFGQLEVVQEGVAVPVRGTKQRALLALLALQRGSRSVPTA